MPRSATTSPKLRLLLADAAVDPFPQQVGVAAVARVLPAVICGRLAQDHP
jgi:hypothetical protein